MGRLVGDDNPQVLSQILANSPVTRFVSTADKILDDRKALLPKLANLLTGVRVTDVDAEKLRSIELRDRTAEMLRGFEHIRPYTNYFVKPEDIPQLSPAEVEAMRFYSELSDRAKAYSKAHRGPAQ